MSDLADGLPADTSAMKGFLVKLIDPDLSNTHDDHTVFQLAWVEITILRREIERLQTNFDKRVEEVAQMIIRSRRAQIAENAEPPEQP